MNSSAASRLGAMAVARAVGAPPAAGGAVGATGGPVAATTAPDGADRPANATVTYGYVDGTTGTVTLATANGTQIDTGVSAVVVGQGGDLDGDGNVEVPYVTSQQTLGVVDRTGETTTLADSAEETKTKMAIGDLDGDGNVEVPYVTSQQTLGVVDRTGETTTLADSAEETKTKMAVGDLDGDGTPRVYYGRDSSTAGSELRWANASGGTGVVASKDTTANAALGVADVTGDGVDELVFVGSSMGLRYYNESAGEVVTFYDSGIGANGGLGVGAPRDFDGDGVAETPIVNGGNDLMLVDGDGTTTAVKSNGNVDKSPVAGVELDPAEGLELLYAADNEVRYVTMAGEVHTVTDADGATVGTTSDAGVAWLNAPDEPFVLESLTLGADSGTLTMAVQLSEQAESLDTTVAGPDGRSFDLSAFEANQSGGSWTYTTSYQPNESGEYTASVDAARSVDGDETEPNETATATVEEPYDAYGLNATAVDGDLVVTFNATHPTEAVDAGVDGPESVALNRSAFTTADDSAPYTYEATVENATGGNYTATLSSATAADGDVDDETMTDDAHVPGFDTYDLTLAPTADGNLTAGFSATHDVADADLSLSGPGNESVAFGAFTETATGPYRYEATVNTSVDGNWTVTLGSATAADGRVDDGALTAEATLDSRTPTVLNATLTDATDGNAAVNDSDRIRVTANVSGDVSEVRADLSGFGAGTVTLSPGDDAGDADYAATVAVENGTEGEHAATVTAVDGQGNADSATTESLTVDTTAPAVSVGDDRTVTAGETVSLSGDASDDGTGVVAQRWHVEGAPDATGPQLNVSYDDPGEYEIRFDATDAAGNTAGETVTVTVEAATEPTPAPPEPSTPTDTPTETDTSTAAPPPGSAPADTATPTATPEPTATPTPTPSATPTNTADSVAGDSTKPTATATATATGTADGQPPADPRTAFDGRGATAVERHPDTAVPKRGVAGALAVLLVIAAVGTAVRRLR